MRLVKPKNNVPTRHLYVSGVGTHFGHSAVDVRRALSIHDDAIVDLLQDGGALKRFVYVSFESVDDAARAYHTIMGGGDKYHVRYAAEEKPPGTAPEPECTSLTAHVHVPGVHLIPSFITAEEEAALLQLLGGDDAPWEVRPAYVPSAAGSGNECRRVQHYGTAAFNYSTLFADQSDHIRSFPDLVERIVARIIVEDALLGTADTNSFTQLTVNEYQPGEGIGAHIDTYGCFGNNIVVLNLGSGIVMTLQKRVTLDEAALTDPSVRPNCRNNRFRGVGSAEGVDSTDDHPIDSKKYIWLPRRSLLLLSGEGRYLYSHGISKRVSDKVNGVVIKRGVRLSLTFRSIVSVGGDRLCTGCELK